VKVELPPERAMECNDTGFFDGLLESLVRFVGRERMAGSHPEVGEAGALITTSVRSGCG
jgi:hypothetical protein